MCRPIHGWPTASLVTVDTNATHRSYRKKKIFNTSVSSALLGRSVFASNPPLKPRQNAWVPSPCILISLYLPLVPGRRGPGTFLTCHLSWQEFPFLVAGNLEKRRSRVMIQKCFNGASFATIHKHFNGASFVPSSYSRFWSVFLGGNWHRTTF